MKDLGAAQSYLGIWITRDRAHQCIWIDQEAYIDSTLSRFHLMDANNTKTPLPAGVHLTKLETPSSTNLRTEYQQLISTLLYVALGTRPDIAFAVTRLSRFNSDPTEEHLRYAKYVLRYLKGTKSLRICYNGSSNAGLIGYSDSNWGENKDDRHSTSGQVFTLANGTISWASQHQKNGCTFSGRIRIHGASSNRTPMRLAQELQCGDRIPIYSSHNNLCGQPSCDFLSNQSSS